MSLTAGDKLGPYEIVEPIGRGGMGEVFRAHDPRTGRDVAIKISAERFSERFDREVRAVAALNHPNICTLFDVGSSPNAPGYLVMEFIEGEAPKGPLPLEEALGIAKQIAAALEEAHEKGITHRDLKPGNIKVKPDGTVKVLDFGLAKMAAPASAGIAENSPTLSMVATQAGVILGTAAYMAPEQAKGKPVDKRADIWAFGIVLHELLTGQRLFQQEDLTETLAAVVMTVPKLDGAPVEVRRLLKKCLEKDPKKRLRDIGDVWELLDAPERSGTEVPLQAEARATRTPMPWIAAVAVLVAALGIALWAPWRSTAPSDRPLVRLDVDLGADVSLPSVSSATTMGGSSVAISPDGTRLAYASGTPSRLFIRRLDQLKATEIPGTQGAVAPFFSPDGQWIGFQTTSKLSKVSVEGGSVVSLSDSSGFIGASWGEDNNILGGGTKGLIRIPGGGGPSESVAESANGEVALVFPQLLPGGKAVLFSSITGANNDGATIDVMTLADRHRKTVVRGGTSPRYLASSPGAGHLVYLNQATLFAIPFDLEKLEARGTALPMLDDVTFQGTLGTAQISYSGTGTLVYRKGGDDTGLLTVGWLDGSGKAQPLLAKPGIYGRPSLSPDGQRLAVEVTEGSRTDIWVYDLQRDTPTRLTFTGNSLGPVWSPDGRYIVFRTVGTGTSVIRSDGAGKPQPFTQSKNVQYPWSFTADGKRMALLEQQSGTAYDLWTVPIESDSAGLRAGKPEVFLQTPADERAPSLSPDGRWMAYASDDSGMFQVYVRAVSDKGAADKGGKWQISSSGGTYPMWSRNGHELFFESLDSRVMAAAYTVKGDTFVADKVRTWSDKQIGGSVNNSRNLDLAADGKRIMALMPAAEAKGAEVAQNHVVFLMNFFDELRRRVPAK